ncbi:hypothetical protein RHMOL_Rhmol02G0257300 [Rhododendron molle]|uniref:Uncharacterized protein n=1 Tax=Rhododendron molle TaxID=49168 RepID=A0ACC0PTU0_RHOML|nr:hypothetical protein RHMOL_Rhmol02G0257300 [Rhododendron molle]
MSAGDCGNGGSGSGCKCGCCCVHNGAKMEDIQPHPVMEQLPGVEKAKVIQTLLFVSGLNTPMQSLFGTRLPSVIGGSYAFVIPMTSILHAKRYHLSSPEPNGDYCTLFLTPLSMVPLMTFTGLGLYYLGFQMLAKCVEIGIPELILMVIVSQAKICVMILQYLPHYATAKTKRRVCDRFALLFSVAFVWGYAQVVHSITLPQSLKLVVTLITLASLLELLDCIDIVSNCMKALYNGQWPCHLLLPVGFSCGGGIESRDRYPIQSMMACNILGIHMLKLPIESAFSAGDRMVDQCRNSLRPDTVQALVCAQDWIWNDSHG